MHSSLNVTSIISLLVHFKGTETGNYGMSPYVCT